MNLQYRDIHNHLLPGVDDGFRDSKSSLAAITKMAAAGCRDIVFTPHLNPDVSPGMTEDRLRSVYDNFIVQIPGSLGVTTSLAAEYMVTVGFGERVRQQPDKLLTFDDGSILIEMSYCFKSLNLERVVFDLTMAGFKPILAHPERYTYMAGTLSEFDHLVEMGCRLQLNFMSLTGMYGNSSRTILNYLLSHGMYSFVATDLHSEKQLDSILHGSPAGFRNRMLFNKQFSHK